MIRIDFTSTFVALDKDAFTDAVVQSMLYTHIEAARRFFIAAVPLVHIDTGMSLGTFIGLAQYLNEEIARLGERKIYNPIRKYRFGPPDLKLPASGAVLSTQRDDLFQIDYDKQMVRFTFKPNVYQFEKYQGWGSIAAGKAAFEAYIASHPIKNPTLGKYLTKTYYRTTKSGYPQKTVIKVRRQRTLRPLADL